MVKRFLSAHKIPVNSVEMEHAVVHVFSHVAPFNWREPYKIREQAENRGTGFFINEDGYLITNAHVVHEAKLIEIRLPVLGRKALYAEIISFCPERDIALLRVVQPDLLFIRQQLGKVSWLELGDSDAIGRTEPILVLGYPLGQYNLKGSTGIVSGYESIESNSLIQITAPINAGNSGGPLINEQGQVVGVTLAISALANNIGYAVPINDLKIILPTLFKTRLLRRPVLGILYSSVSDDEARFLHNPVPAGLYINKVGSGTIAEKMDIKVGDMIYAIDECPVDSFGQTVVPFNDDRIALHDLFNRIPQGDDITIMLYRHGLLMNVHGTFNLTPPYPIREIYPDYEPVDYEIIAGLVIMQLTDNHIAILQEDMPWLMLYEQIDNKTKPVLVISHVLPSSQADNRESLSAGQILTQINGQEIATLEELRKALGRSVETGFITLKTQQHVFAAFPLKETVQEMSRLSQEFHYPLSAAIKEFIATK